MRIDILIMVALMLLPLVGTGGIAVYVYWILITGIYIAYVAYMTERWS
jgi:hypothetical protein